jgi:hypothetical protein
MIKFIAVPGDGGAAGFKLSLEPDRLLFQRMLRKSCRIAQGWEEREEHHA